MNSLQQRKHSFSHIGVMSEVSDTDPEGCLCACEDMCVSEGLNTKV